MWQILGSSFENHYLRRHSHLCLLRLWDTSFSVVCLCYPIGRTAFPSRVSSAAYPCSDIQLCSLYQGPGGKMWLVPTVDSSLLNYS